MTDGRTFLRCATREGGMKVWAQSWRVVDEGNALQRLDGEGSALQYLSGFSSLRYDRCYCNGRLYRGVPTIAHHLLVGLVTGTHEVPLKIRGWVFEYAAKCPEELKEGEECRGEKLY